MCNAALRITSGHSREDLYSDETLRMALTHAVAMLGEACRHVSQEVRTKYPNVAWIDISDTRNRLIHGYPSVDLDILWDVRAVDIPALIPQLEQILNEL